MTNQPAGWYPDGIGATRYWDGNAWTEHVQQPAQPAPAQQSVPQRPISQQAAPEVVVAQAYSRAALPTNRSLTKFILLGLITFGIYGIYVTARSGDDLNTLGTPLDGARTMNFWLMALVINIITLGIGSWVWWSNSSGRIGRQMQARGLAPTVNSGTFWLWGFLGSLIIVGPFIFLYKWLHAMNSLCADFNERGDLTVAFVQ